MLLRPILKEKDQVYEGIVSLNMARFTLGKNDRLCSEKAIARLFASGQSVSKFPIRLVWLEVTPNLDDQPPVQVMFSVSKKKFPRAVDRNRIKRLLREAYRMQKPVLYESISTGRCFHISLLYTATEILTFEAIQKSMIQSLERWKKSIEQTVNPTGLNP